MHDFKSDLKNLGIALAVVFIMLQILFFKTPIVTTIKAALAIYWIIIIPGFWLTYLYSGLSFVERLALSVPVSAALVGISAYYLGLAGVHVMYSAAILPLAFAALSIAIVRGRNNGD